jgi:hypothetical protein
MKLNVSAGIAALALFAGSLAIALAASVYGDRGRDETFYLTIHALPVAAGDMVAQPVPLQRADASAIEVPYRWLGAAPATVEETLATTGGSTVFDRTEQFPNSRGNRLLQPTGNGSVWQNLTAVFKVIPLPRGLPDTVVLSLKRVDSNPGTLFFFASNSIAPPAGADLGTQPDKRPAMIGRPGQVLDLETEYGAPRPAVAKVPTYLERIQSIAPPWMPAAVFVLMVVAMVGVAIFLYAIVLTPTRSR